MAAKKTAEKTFDVVREGNRQDTETIQADKVPACIVLINAEDGGECYFLTKSLFANEYWKCM